MANILVVDDEDKMRRLLAIMLGARGYSVDQASDGQEAMAMIEAQKGYDLVVTDIKMPRMDGITLLGKIKASAYPCPVISISAFATVDSAVEAMRCGAVDYITKPFEEERIQLAVEKALSVSRLMLENRELKDQLLHASGFDRIVYASRQMAEIMDLAKKVAASEATVLVTGESGTGKEVIARYIHCASQRKAGRFVAVNCASISPALVESELFGHEKGSFTGAIKQTDGKFEFAGGGTIFLDEIGDLPLDAQAKLLRVIQDKRITRVGGNHEVPVDVRLVCATNQKLEQLVEQGKFRHDLFFRINVFPLHLPPLRERADDIMPLALYFLGRFGGGVVPVMTADAARILCASSWPGNVRELANAMERAVILAGSSRRIDGQTLSFLGVAQSGGQAAGPGVCLPQNGISLEELEQQLVREALQRANNNQTKAAELLGLTRAKFRIYLKRF